MPSIAKDFLDIIKDIRGTTFDDAGLPTQGFWYDVKTWKDEVSVDKGLVAANTATTAANTALALSYRDAALVAETNAETAEANALSHANTSSASANEAKAYKDTVVAKEAIISPYYTDIAWIGNNSTKLVGIYSISSAINNVSANTTNVVRVGNSITNVNTVGNNIADVNTTATSIAAIIASGYTLSTKLDAAINSVAQAKDWASKATDSLVDGIHFSARHYSIKAAESSTSATTSAITAANMRLYAQEWAIQPENTIVSLAAGGGTGNFSALHYSNKAAASAVSANVSATTATNAANNISANVTAATNAATQAAASAVSAGSSATTALNAAATTTGAAEAAWEWANEDEDVLIDDGVHTPAYSAYHWSQKAEAIVGGNTNFTSLSDTPGSFTGSAGRVVRVNISATALEFVNLTKTDVGLANVDNTSDVNKPISTATQSALDNKASIVDLNAIDGRVDTLEANTAGQAVAIAAGNDPIRHLFSNVVYSSVVQNISTLQDQALTTYAAVKAALAAETIGAY